MLENHNKFFELLKKMDININSTLSQGAIQSIVIKKADMLVRISLLFPQVIDVEDANYLIDAVEGYFVEKLQFQKAIVTLLYEKTLIRSDILEHYFTYIIDHKKNDQTRFLAYEQFSKSFDKNEITIFVADQNEAFMLKDLNREININLDRYGLSAKINTCISTFEIPIQKIIDKNITDSTKELMKDQALYEKNVDEVKRMEKSQKPNKGKNLINYRSRTQIEPTPLKQIPASETECIEYRQKFGHTNFAIIGEVFQAEIIERTKRDSTEKYKIYQATITDGEDSLMIKTFINLDQGKDKEFEEIAIPGKRIKAIGRVDFDHYQQDVIMNLKEFQVLPDVVKEEVLDTEPIRRVELHAHTKMTVQDSVMDVEEYVRQAVKFKHRALAVTDRHNIHVFPDFYNATKDLDILPIFGVEGSLVDEKNFRIALEEGEQDLSLATYIVYDFETTGLSSNYNEIIEIAAVKIQQGIIIDEFSYYVKPKKAITAFITDLTSITNDDVRFADPIEVVLPQFYDFIKGCILVAHNAIFDNSHLYANLKRIGLSFKPLLTIDTLQLSKVRYGHKLKTFNLKAVAKFFDVELEQHHRAIYDAKTTAKIFIKMLTDLLEDGIKTYSDINRSIDENEAYRLARPSHFTILVKNVIGKKNLYKIITDSHTVHYHKEPLMVKKFLETHREGLLFGSGCMNGDVFKIAYERNEDELKEAMKFYDFIEIQPPSQYELLTERYKDSDMSGYIRDIIKRIILVAKELGKPVVATGNVHHLRKEDRRLREIYITAPKLGGGTHNLSDIDVVPSFHYMTTREMLDEFKFLGDDLANEVVITNSNKIADQIERFELFPNQLFAPRDDFLKDRGVPSLKDAVKNMTYENAYARYGNPLPQFIADRLEKELSSIIGNNFASIYYISYLLVKHSTDAGYVVGSRGSVGSSLVANLMNITEVNPLPPHYNCPNCHFTSIKLREEDKKRYPRQANEVSLEEAFDGYGTGFDLPSMNCPVCGSLMNQNGVDIPFETFLGFKGEKIPDIDLNFSGDYQAKAHEFCRELFGVDHVFRAGTISTIASKTAYGYVCKYFEKKGIQVRKAEINRIITKIEGAKRSTGQHPGGIVVIPQEIEYTDLIPVQNPADDPNASWRTTHFDYHKFESNLLKLDILGHDDPTMIRHLMDFVNSFPNEFPFKTVDEIPLTDDAVFGLFKGLQSLGLTSDQLNGEMIGTTGLPEFGTSLTKEMLKEINPQTVSDLLKVSGLSHGTNVWRGNALDFLLGLRPEFPAVPFKDLIGCRDDIMVYLIDKGLPSGDAFKIMENVRKGRGVSNDYEKEMLSYNVPKWYIESCKLIKYMFPKAHATAYVIMALRIGWFKVHAPIFYYAAYFSRRTDAFDVVAMAGGYQDLVNRVRELDNKIKSKRASIKETDIHYSLLLALEMTARGFHFVQMDIARSNATHFKVSNNRQALLIPFNALDSLGETTAQSIVDARDESPFTSKRDVMRRTKLNSTQFERMDQMGVFGNLPEDDQIGLF
ncbi:MAG: PolC-type DNA polymerase III [Bacilli bacterium]